MTDSQQPVPAEQPPVQPTVEQPTVEQLAAQQQAAEQQALQQQLFAPPPPYVEQPYPPQQSSPYQGQPRYQQAMPPNYVNQPVSIAVGYTAGAVVPKGLSVASMVLGLVSIVLGFTFVTPLTGLILGIVGARREPLARGFSVTGIILNGLMLLGWVMLLAFLFSIAAIGAGAAATSGVNS